MTHEYNEVTTVKIKWTPDKEEIVRENWLLNKKAIQIAALIPGATVRAIICKAASMRLPKQKHRRLKPEAKSRKTALNFDGPTARYVEKKHVALGKPRKLEELNEYLCRWPIGDPKLPDFHFCGADCPLTKTYCEAHEKMSRSGS